MRFSYVLMSPVPLSIRRFNIWVGKYVVFTRLVEANTRLDKCLTYFLGRPEY